MESRQGRKFHCFQGRKFHDQYSTPHSDEFDVLNHSAMTPYTQSVTKCDVTKWSLPHGISLKIQTQQQGNVLRQCGSLLTFNLSKPMTINDKSDVKNYNVALPGLNFNDCFPVYIYIFSPLDSLISRYE